MAFLRVQRKQSGHYYLIVKNERRGGKVVQRCLEYLGKDPAHARLRRALHYWGVNAKGGDE
jgi:hypothetical protein